MHKKECNSGTVQSHVESPTITIIESNNGDKSDKDCVKIKSRRNPISQRLDLYEFKMNLFDNRDPEEFLFFMDFEVSRRFNTFVHWHLEKRYISFTRSLMR